MTSVVDAQLIKEKKIWISYKIFLEIKADANTPQWIALRIQWFFIEFKFNEISITVTHSIMMLVGRYTLS